MRNSDIGYTSPPVKFFSRLQRLHSNGRQQIELGRLGSLKGVMIYLKNCNILFFTPYPTLESSVRNFDIIGP